MKASERRTRKETNNMKTKIISKTLLSLGLAFVLVSAIAHSPALGSVVTIRSTGDVARGETGSFVVYMTGSPFPWGGALVNFSVSGTAIPGVDYVALISPAHVVVWVPPPPQCEHCQGYFYGVIPVKTLPDLRGSFFPQAYSVVVTLKPGLGYTIGEHSSAQMMINP
jgi:hypothetical protein